MTNHHGDFIWYELMTSDVESAADFYGAVIGWKCRSFDSSNRYRLFSAGQADVAGLMALPAEGACSSRGPGWLGYIGVDDVDTTADRVVRDGGTQHVPPTDIPGVGRFAMLTDPQGATFYAMRGASGGTSESFAPTKTGRCHWNELSTNDQPAAIAFYAKQFGWQKGDAMPMGAMGDYQFLTHRGQAFGAVMRRREDGPPPMWTFYFGVEDIDAAAKIATGKGAVVHYGPAEVPGGIFIIVASDPQGALFGLVGQRRS